MDPLPVHSDPLSANRARLWRPLSGPAPPDVGALEPRVLYVHVLKNLPSLLAQALGLALHQSAEAPHVLVDLHRLSDPVGCLGGVDALLDPIQTLHQAAQGVTLQLCQGSPQVLLGRCLEVLGGPGVKELDLFTVLPEAPRELALYPYLEEI